MCLHHLEGQPCCIIPFNSRIAALDWLLTATPYPIKPITVMTNIDDTLIGCSFDTCGPICGQVSRQGRHFMGALRHWPTLVTHNLLRTSKEII